MLSNETKTTIEWMGNYLIKEFQNKIKNLEEIMEDEETRLGNEENLIKIYDSWIGEIAEAVYRIKKE